MPILQKPSVSRQAGSLLVLIEQSDASECKTPNRPYLQSVSNDTRTMRIIRPNCGLWGCEACSKVRASGWFNIAAYGADVLLAGGVQLFMVTLTSHRKVRSAAGGVRVWRDAWKKLGARWRRQSPGLQYVFVGEYKPPTKRKVKATHFHCHMITTADTGQAWYKDNAAQCGLGYMATVEKVTSAAGAGFYVSKYLFKSIAVSGWPKYWRRVNTSRGWLRPPKDEHPEEWLLIGKDPLKVASVIENYVFHGWAVTLNNRPITTR